MKIISQALLIVYLRRFRYLVAFVVLAALAALSLGSLFHGYVAATETISYLNAEEQLGLPSRVDDPKLPRIIPGDEALLIARTAKNLAPTVDVSTSFANEGGSLVVTLTGPRSDVDAAVVAVNKAVTDRVVTRVRDSLTARQALYDSRTDALKAQLAALAAAAQGNTAQDTYFALRSQEVSVQEITLAADSAQTAKVLSTLTPDRVVRTSLASERVLSLGRMSRYLPLGILLGLGLTFVLAAIRALITTRIWSPSDVRAALPSVATQPATADSVADDAPPPLRAGHSRRSALRRIAADGAIDVTYASEREVRIVTLLGLD